ncbi:T9SS type A sorting domain-containing protein [Adhaeribacter sp. BT258]|uniref:T9SS type A sorting domain-containing protein n=1 Tax=Adhaeribacter terrigena TaxID=2793070 RepID=A0ABS1C818_9BACT|nr:T9SS type A sorting domain-containing protein [Adhaeribacter terrigena]MBK0404808.1 T9SS type A sorting domain-containing protein [Adhaeribacter terrigena]
MKIFTRIFGLTFFIFTLHTFAMTGVCSGSTANGAAAKPQVQTERDKVTASLDAYPNPSRGEIYFTLSKATGEDYKIRISNAIGRVVKTVDLSKATADTRVQVDLTGMPAGFYFYSLIANDKMIETKRLIVQR